MTEQIQKVYDKIAEQYHRTGILPIKGDIVAPSIADRLGSLEGKSAIDFACGSGFSTRLLKSLGASRVVGVDISLKEIEIARRIEEEQKQGIEYHLADLSQPLRERLGKFDIVSGFFLFHYASNREELEAMARNVYNSLNKGGRFVGVNVSPTCNIQCFFIL
jgi:toxoflavin synthase